MTKNRINSRYCLIGFIFLFLLFFLLTCTLWPLKDDWDYARHNAELVQLLKPDAQFWRPFDGLLGAVDGLLPVQCFPILNRVLVVLTHIGNAFLIGKILENLEVRKSLVILSICLFLFSSAAVATWVSPDGVAQACSVLFGLVALYYSMTKTGYWYLLFLFLSLFWKESGISWFIVVVLFQLYRTRPLKWKQLLLIILIPAVSICVYFCVRFSLQGVISLGNADSRRYQLSLFSISTVVNFFMLTGLSFSGIDTIALFSNGKNLFLVGITMVLSLPLIMIIIVGIIKVLRQKKKENTLQLVVLVLSLLLLTGPLILMASVGEMHAYPALAGSMLLVGWILDRTDLISHKWVKGAIVCIFVAFTISTTHKLVTIHRYSAQTKELTKEIYQNYQNPEESLLLIVYQEPENYSVFVQPAIDGTAGGASLQKYFGWGKLPLEIERINSDEECKRVVEEKKDEYDHICVVKPF